MLRKRKIDGKIQLYFAIHFNQNIVPYLDFVSLGFYNQLISTLLKFPKIPINIHISGTALSGILWFNPSLIELIKLGINSGQFELMFSTYSQAIPQSISEDEFFLQVEKHKEILTETFDVHEFITFWNPERIWTPELFDLLTETETKFSFIEDRVIKESLENDEILPIELTKNEKNITFLPDFNDLRVKFNNFLVSGNLYSIERYFREYILKNPSNNVMVYGEDAEAFGLWEFEKMKDFPIDEIFKNLKRFFEWIESIDFIEIKKISEFSEKSIKKNYDFLKQKESLWIERAFEIEGEKYHEEGFKNWFDYNKNSSILSNYRKLHEKTIKKIGEYIGKRPFGYKKELVKKIGPLIELSQYMFIHSQYEFGCPGILSGNDTQATRVVESSIPVELFYEFLKGKSFVQLLDIDSDGEEEIVIIHYSGVGASYLYVMIDDFSNSKAFTGYGAHAHPLVKVGNKWLLTQEYPYHWGRVERAKGENVEDN
jgi:hypothetical protein